MPKFIKNSKVVLILSGRYAGKKAVIVKNVDDGTPDRPYPHAIVAGVARYPLKVHKKMPQKKIAKRSRVKPFIKAVNYNHIMPTRYNLDLADGLKQIVTVDTLADDGKRVEARKAVKKAFEERYASGKNPYFFKPLRF